MSEAVSGLLVVDKPGGLTSHGVVSRVRRVAGTRKVGHAGTLDPMATGVLVLGLNRGTRLLHYLVGADKAYSATVRLGTSTTTDDAEGEVVAVVDASAVDEPSLRRAARRLTGEIDQVPSAVSAIKVGGKRSYARVRAGESVTLESRRVTVSRLDVVAVRRVGAHLDADVEVECSSGTYVRALARDLGTDLGVGGHLTALRRTRVGPFGVGEAVPLDDLDSPVGQVLIDLGEAAARFLPVRRLTADESARARHGVAPKPSDVAGPVALIDDGGALVAIAEDAGPRAHLRAVFVG